MSSLVARLGVELPIVQAGMGGGITRHELAAAVSDSGGLGTIGLLPAESLRAEIAAARRLTSRPIAVNVLLPFARRAHFRAAEEANLVVTFWGTPRRRTAAPWAHQAGSVAEARAAHAAGADAVIVQGREAGGHVRGSLPALELLERVRAALPDGYPLWLAGGVASADDVAAARAAGADAAVLGTRFLMSEESHAHPVYEDRLRAGRETILTELFGAGWPAPHRVLPNAATARWLGRDARGPAWLRAANVVSAPLASRLPVRAQETLTAAQSPRRPIFSPAPPTDAMPARLVEAAPLYAGETVARIDDVRPARELTKELAASL